MTLMKDSSRKLDCCVSTFLWVVYCNPRASYHNFLFCLPAGCNLCRIRSTTNRRKKTSFHFPNFACTPHNKSFYRRVDKEATPSQQRKRKIDRETAFWVFPQRGNHSWGDRFASDHSWSLQCVEVAANKLLTSACNLFNRHSGFASSES